MTTADFDPYSTALHQEARRTQRKFPELTYHQSVRLVDKKARSVQLSYAEVLPPLHGCVVSLTEGDIEQAFMEGLL